MKKRPFMPPSEQANARVFDGTNWYVAANETENNYSGSALQSNLAAAVSANAVNTGTGYTLGAQCHWTLALLYIKSPSEAGKGGLFDAYDHGRSKCQGFTP